MDISDGARGMAKRSDSRKSGNREKNLPKTVLRRVAIARAAIEVMESRLLMSSTTWTGLANDNLWTTPENWANNMVPVAGEDVTFPSSSVGSQSINLTGNVEVGNFTIDDGYQFNDISGGGVAAITVDGDIDSEASGTNINNVLMLNHNATINVGTGADLTLWETDDNGNGYGITKTGNGLLDLEGPADYYSGTTDISAGTLDVVASLGSDPVKVDTGATLEGTGNVYDIQALGGTVSLNDLGGNPSTLTSLGSISLANSTLQEVISSTSSVESDGMLTAYGPSVYVTGATLDISVQNGYTPAIGDQFTLISNHTGSPVTGTFNGLPEGAQTAINGVTYQITYQGNNANDVVLTVVPSTDVWAGGVDNNWSTAGNWQSGTVPASGDNIVLPDLGHIQAINLSGNVSVGNITLSGNYTINSNGNSLSPSGTVTSYSTGSTINGLVLSDNTTINIGASASLALNNISGSYSIAKTGPGTLILGNSTDTQSGTVVSSGTLEDDGSQTSDITVDTGATLDGSGTPSGITSNGGSISLDSGSGPQTLSSSGSISLDSGSTLQEVIAQTSGIETDGELAATGHFLGVSLNGATLEITTLNGFKPAIGHIITLISNGTATGISGTFNGLAEGAVTKVNGVNYQVSYLGGSSGHDVTLTVVPDVWIGADNGNWSDAGNWQSGVVPASGDSVDFPFRNPNLRTVNLTGNVTVGDITFDGNYQLANDTITLDGNITSTSTGLSTGIVSQLVLAHNATVTVGAGKILGLYSAGNGGNGYGITKEGAGTLFFLGGNGPGFTAATEVAQGALEVDNITTPSSVTVDAGATLQGNGTAAGITDNGGTVLLNQFLGYGTTLASSGPVSLGSGSTLHEVISNNGMMETDGKLVATGSSVTLTGSTLTLSALYGFTPAIGDVITLISNHTGSAINGTFSGLANGAVKNFNGVNYQISYTGGSGHDVTLTVVPDQWTGAANDGGNWNTAGNWASGIVPASGDSVVFPAHGGGLTDISLGSDVEVGDITFNGNYHLTGSTITLDGSITSNSSETLLQNNLVLTHNTTITVDSGDMLILYAISDGGNHYGITDQGVGTLSLVQNSSYTGTTVVTAGTLNVNLVLHSSITLDAGTTLTAPTSFGGTAGITDNGGTIELGQYGYPGDLAVSGSISLGSGSTLQEDSFVDSTFGEQDGELFATGSSTSINLTGSTLALSLQGNATPSIGNVITLISNQTGNAITGTFNGLAEGAVTSFNGVNYQVSYVGGSGNDVTLTVVAPAVAPVVSTNPSNATINAGGNKTFVSAASGSPAPTAQWQVSTNGGATFININNGGVYSGATTSTLTITGGASALNGNQYRDVFTNTSGSDITLAATLTVDYAPVISFSSGSQTVNAGGNSSFTAFATGNPAPTVQWQVSTNGGTNFTNITNGGVYSGATTSTLSITAATASMDGYKYQAVYSNTLFNAGAPSTTTSTPATLTVDNAPNISINPSNTTVNANGNTSLSAAATGDPTPTVQWQLSINGGTSFNDLTNGGFYSGVTTNTLSITAAQAFMSSYEYRAVYSNTLLGAGSPSTATTTAATLTVDYAPTVTGNPINQTINAGGNTIYNATANGTPTPTAQWQVSTDGGNTFNDLTDTGVYSGTTSNTMHISGATAGMNAYNYRAVFSNTLFGHGSPSQALSTTASLTVDSVPVVVTNPSNTTVNSGSNETITAAITDGVPTPTTYQWQISVDSGTNWNNLTNTGPYSTVTTETLHITAASAGLNGDEYRLVAGNSAFPSSVTTTAATLAVAFAPSVNMNPIDQTIMPGGNTSFSAGASGNPTPSIQWQVSSDGGATFTNVTNGGIYSGAITNTLTLTGATSAQNAYEYQAIFSNLLFGAGVPSTAVTTPATLTIETPTITASTASLTLGSTAFGTASASQSYTVSGNDLTADIVMTAPIGVELSLDNSTWQSSQTLTETGGAVGTTTLYARISASASAGTISGNITVASTGATTQNISVTGTVVPTVQFSAGSETVNQTTGTFSIPVTILGTRSTFASGFSSPGGAAFDSAGNLYVANFSANSVSKVTPAGVVSTFASGFNHPNGLAFDSAGNLYVSNTLGNSVSKVTPGGVVSTFASGFSTPHQLAFDAAGNLYVANPGNGTVSKVTSAGVVSTFASGLNTAVGLAFDASGNLYVANNSLGTVSKVTPGGTVSTFASGFDYPQQLAFDTAGNLYVTNRFGNNVSVVTSAGVVSTFASGFNTPWGLTYRGGDLYVTDFGTNTVNQISASQINVTVPFTTGGTAVSGTDYSGITVSPLTFAPGQTTATITGTLPSDPGTNPTLTITLGTPTNASLGSTSVNTLTINEPAGTPVVSTNPTNAIINAGGNASFTSAATGSPTPTEQWQVSTNAGATFNNITNGGVYSGATSPTLSITGGLASMSEYEYQDVFTNSNGSATTTSSTLTVDAAPTVTTNPTNTTINTGSNTTFIAAATGNPTPTVQWQVSTDGGATFNTLTNTGIYSGVATGTLTLTGATSAQNAYEYQAVFSNTLFGAGSPSAAMTTPVTLTVDQAPAITSAASHTFTVGQNGSFTIQTTGFPIGELSETGALPGGVTFVDHHDGTATLTGTPDAATGGTYHLMIGASNGVQPAASQSFTLTLDQAPAITGAASVTFIVGQSDSYSMTTTGFPIGAMHETGTLPIGITFTDNNNGTATLGGTPTAGTDGSYNLTLAASNGVSPDATLPFTLTVDAAPVVITSPMSTTINAGDNVSFTSLANGYPVPIEQWQVSSDGGSTFSNISDAGVYSGSNTRTLSISGGTAAMNGDEYRDVFTNGNGTANTDASTLTVDFAPIVTANPINEMVHSGATASFTATAIGNPPATAQWQLSTDGGATFNNLANGGIYAGVTADTLTVTGVTPPENGYEYQAVFSNALLGATATRTATTSPAVLNVGAPVITVSPYARMVSSTSNTGTLHVQGEQDGTDANLIYTWSIISQPAAVPSEVGNGADTVSTAPLALFSINGTNSAKNTSATFLASGQYTLQVVASNGTQSVASQVQVTAVIKPSAAQATTQTTELSGVQTVGDAKSITGFVVTFNGPLDPTTAQDVRGYRVLEQSNVGKNRNFMQWLFGTNPGTQTETSAFKIASAVYNPQTDSVSLTLATPMAVKNGVRLVQVIGTGPHAVLDADGKPIDGDSNGKVGGTFTYRLSMSVAKSVAYRTANGDAVKLPLSGPGEIVSLLPAGSSAPIITLTGTNTASSILTGKLRKGRRSLGYVVLDQLNGTAKAEIQLGNEFHVNEYDASSSQG